MDADRLWHEDAHRPMDDRGELTGQGVVVMTTRARSTPVTDGEPSGAMGQAEGVVEPTRPGTVVVGVDASATSRLALAWARDMARRTGWTLEVVTSWPDQEEPLIHEVPGHYCEPRHRAERTQRTALEEVGLDEVGLGGDEVVVVECALLNGHAADVLAQRAQNADLLVVGESSPRESANGVRRGVDTLVSLLAPCPVVVVGPADPPQASAASLGRSSG